MTEQNFHHRAFEIKEVIVVHTDDWKIAQDLAETFPGVVVITLKTGDTIESLSEADMAEHGWFKRI